MTKNKKKEEAIAFLDRFIMKKISAQQADIGNRLYSVAGKLQ